MQAQRYLGNFDWLLFLPAVALPLIGAGVIFTATSGTPVAGAFHRQLVWIGLGIAALFLALLIDYHTLAEFSYVFYGAALALLLGTLVFGHVVNSSRSWLGFAGVQFQPSELAKSATILMLAAYLGRGSARGLSAGRFLGICTIVGLPVLLIMRQPDLGTAVTFAPLLAGATFLAGIRIRVLVVLGLIIALTLPLVWGHLKPYQQERVKTFLEPTRDPKGSGYQLIQSLIAVGSGGVTGKGFFSGTQGQLQFLPEQHTDFIFAVMAEEGGFVGSTIILCLYFLLIHRCIAIARGSRDRLGSYIAIGVVSILGCQAILNIGVVVGLLPTTGVPLPLVSYGGSSLLSTLIGVGLVLNVWMRRLVN